MGAVDKIDAHKRRFRAENLRVDLIECVSAYIVIAVAGGSRKAAVRHAVILKRGHHAERVFLGNVVDFSKPCAELCLRPLGHFVNFRSDIGYFHVLFKLHNYFLKVSSALLKVFEPVKGGAGGR